MTNPESAEQLRRAESLIRSVPDHPAPGIVFRDVMPLLADGPALCATVAELARPFAGAFDAVAGIEARGFLLAGALAAATRTGLVPVRKAGKLPLPAAREEYALEYGTAAIEMQTDLPAGASVLVIDDVLATGGTVAACHRLLAGLGYRVVGTAVLFEIAGLGGRERLNGAAVHTVFRS